MTGTEGKAEGAVMGTKAYKGVAAMIMLLIGLKLPEATRTICKTLPNEF